MTQQHETFIHSAPKVMVGCPGSLGGDCDGSCQSPPPPEIWKDCDACSGQGYISETIHVYEAGCGFSHPDVNESPCNACQGDGGFICEAEGDR